MRKRISIFVLILACALALGIIVYLSHASRSKASGTQEASVLTYSKDIPEAQNSTAVTGSDSGASAEDKAAIFNYNKDAAGSSETVPGSNNTIFAINEPAVSDSSETVSVVEEAANSGSSESVPIEAEAIVSNSSTGTPAVEEAAVSKSNADISASDTSVSISEANTPAPDTSVSASETSASVSEVSTSISDTSVSTSEASTSSSDSSTSVSEASTSVSDISASTSEASTSTSESSASTSEASTSISDSSASTSEVNTSASDSSDSASEASTSASDSSASTSEEGEDAPIANEHVVCLDPGHQSYEIDMSEGEPNGPGSSVTKAKASFGTQGVYTGIPEYALNLDVSLLVRDILEKRGYKVIMTRTDNDTAISNMERALMAGDEGAEIFVRIHANGENSHQSSGALALCPSESNPYVASLSQESHRLSACILDAYCTATGFSNLGVQENDTMTGINWSSVPVTILEMGFMTNESDDNQMANAEFREVMARGIVNGIDSYFGIDTSAYETAEDGTSAAGAESGLSGSTQQAGGAEASASSAGSELGAGMQQDAAMKALQSQLTARLPNDNGSWSVYVGDLSTGSAASIESRPMQAASLIKLYIMGAIYENYERITAVHSTEEVDKLLHAMITASDNDAANTLTAYLGDGDSDVGMKMVTSYCTSHGYTDSSMGRLLLHSNEFGDNYTSVQDCGLFLTRIYNNCNGNSSDLRWADAMYSLLKQQTRRNKIPSQLPANVHVANKTGELGDVENDAGIIYDTSEGKDLVVCFMSEGVRTPGAAQTAIGELSKFIYSYYNK